jgi:hypothetical protein
MKYERAHSAECNRADILLRLPSRRKWVFVTTSATIRLYRTWPSRIRGIDSTRDLTEQTDDVQFFGAPRPAGAFGSGLRSGGNSSNTAFIAVTALPCSAISLSASGVLALMSDTF